MSVSSRSCEPPMYYPCCCGCAELTQRRFFPGCDTALYGRLRQAIAAGDRIAMIIYKYVYKNNRPITFRRQRELLLWWVTTRGIQR